MHRISQLNCKAKSVWRLLTCFESYAYGRKYYYLIPQKSKKQGRIKDLKKQAGSLETEDFHRVWNFIVPSNEENENSPTRFIPLLTKKHSPRNYRRHRPKN
jgi:hypothetical protein